MKKIIRIFFLLLVLVIAICGFSFLTDKSHYEDWIITKQPTGTTAISWAPFMWVNDSINGKYVERTAMFIPAKAAGLPYNFTFQFDLGADKSGLYETSLSSFFTKYPLLKSNIKKLKSPLQFWNKQKTYAPLQIFFGNYNAYCSKAFLYAGYGELFNSNSLQLTDTFHIGTIGADMFKDKVLIIDYPNRQFAICENIPMQYNNNLVNIELDAHGRVILPMALKGKQYRVLFDNGSSLFPLMATTGKRPYFSNNPVTDSVEVSSWGKKHIMDSRMITDSFMLGGKTFCNVKVYENHAALGIDKNTDAMAGNFLFWNNTVVIDFKNKKIGIE